jgi:poly(A) polymerase
MSSEPEAPLPTALPSEPANSGPEILPELLDADAVRVVHRLRQHGHQAYLVGGCVRDLLLGLHPKDFDVATSAHPGEVRALFRNSRLIGRRFRLALILFKDKWVEVSTFRSNPTDADEATEGASAEGDLLISDDNVFGTAEEDARRRDFTVNGLFYDPEEGRVVDHVRGLRDLQMRRLRTIGDPELRMREDPVRLLRAARFAARLGLDIEPRTYAAMEGAVEDLPRCALPRLFDNTLRMLRGGAAEEGLRLTAALGALRYTVPPLARFLDEGDDAARAAVFAHARTLDARTRSGIKWDEAQLLAAVLSPLARVDTPADVPEGKLAVAPSVNEVLEEWVRAARLPRRWAERCKALLWAQSILSGERRRRGSLASFRRHPLFQDALALFDLSVEATGQHQSELQAWKDGAAPEVPVGSSGPKRRRRRGRRRGPRPPEGTSAGPGEPAAGPPLDIPASDRA